MNAKTNSELLDIIEATIRCGEDADCESCPLYLEDDCKQHYLENNLETEALIAVGALRSATIPRETAKCAPTEADEYKRGKLYIVLAFDMDCGYWLEHTVQYINDDPSRCPFWLPMPAAPEDQT